MTTRARWPSLPPELEEALRAYGNDCFNAGYTAARHALLDALPETAKPAALTPAERRSAISYAIQGAPAADLPADTIAGLCARFGVSRSTLTRDLQEIGGVREVSPRQTDGVDQSPEAATREPPSPPEAVTDPS